MPMKIPEIDLSRYVGISSGNRALVEIRGNFLTQTMREHARVTTTTVSCCTNAGLGERAVGSVGLRCRHRSPSPMEYVRDEAGSAASARSGGGARSRFRWHPWRACRV